MKGVSRVKGDRPGWVCNCFSTRVCTSSCWRSRSLIGYHQVSSPSRGGRCARQSSSDAPSGTRNCHGHCSPEAGPQRGSHRLQLETTVSGSHGPLATTVSSCRARSSRSRKRRPYRVSAWSSRSRNDRGENDGAAPRRRSSRNAENRMRSRRSRSSSWPRCRQEFSSVSASQRSWARVSGWAPYQWAACPKRLPPGSRRRPRRSASLSRARAAVEAPSGAPIAPPATSKKAAR